MESSKIGLIPLLLSCFVSACNHSEPVNAVVENKRTAPMFERAALFTADKGGYFCYRIPALAVSAKGTMLAFCEARKNNCNDWDDIDIAMKRSFDNGKSWEEMKVVRGEGTNSINQPTVVDRSTGTISLVFYKNNQQVLVIRSTDEGASWSEPVEITRHLKDPAWHYVGAGPGHAIQLGCPRRIGAKSSFRTHFIATITKPHGNGVKPWDVICPTNARWLKPMMEPCT